MVGALDIPHEAIRPVRRSEYDELVRLGKFAGERLELLYGRIVRMNPQRAPHATTISRLTRLLISAVGETEVVRIQLPLALSEHSEPEPDVALVARGDYEEEHPRTAKLVIEVADSSVALDRGAKGRLYAEAGVPEYWIVNLKEEVIERYTEPGAGGYGSVTKHARGERLALPSADEPLAVSDVLPPVKA